jgi:hypothetical protein
VQHLPNVGKIGKRLARPSHHQTRFRAGFLFSAFHRAHERAHSNNMRHRLIAAAAGSAMGMGCVFHANRAAVPRQSEQTFHVKPSEDSTAKRALRT